MVGLITEDNETAYKEIRDLAVRWQDYNISLNVSKTKQLIVDNRKWRARARPHSRRWAVVEGGESFKFLGVDIIKDLL